MDDDVVLGVVCVVSDIVLEHGNIVLAIVTVALVIDDDATTVVAGLGNDALAATVSADVVDDLLMLFWHFLQPIIRKKLPKINLNFAESVTIPPTRRGNRKCESVRQEAALASGAAATVGSVNMCIKIKQYLGAMKSVNLWEITAKLYSVLGKLHYSSQHLSLTRPMIARLSRY